MKSELNQFGISKVLGSRMTPVRPATFGNLVLLETTAEALNASQNDAITTNTVGFTYDHDRVVARAFEAVREGFSPDTILWDTALAKRFADKCRELGVNAPDEILGRRLINIRKNKQRFKRHGVELTATTKSEPHPSIVHEHSHVIEFALVRLRYRFGASIDDILLDPILGHKFETLAKSIAQNLSSQEIRLGALYIRKSRYLKKNEIARVLSLDVSSLEAQWSQPVYLSDAKSNRFPSGPGLLELREEDRYLYISRNDRLAAAIERLQSPQSFSVVAEGFWKPDLSRISIQFIEGHDVDHVGIGIWERRLIHDREPMFNWPIQKAA